MSNDFDKMMETIGNVQVDKIPDPIDKRIDRMLAALDEEDNLNEWEKEFVYDVTVRFSQDRQLSDKQFNTLCDIYGKYL